MSAETEREENERLRREAIAQWQAHEDRRQRRRKWLLAFLGLVALL